MEYIKVVDRSFHYSERLKSNISVAMKALDRIAKMEGIELEGAIEVMRGLFEGLGTEIGIAKTHLASKEFTLAVTKAVESEAHIDLHEYRAKKSLPEAISYTTTLSSKHLGILKEKELIQIFRRQKGRHSRRQTDLRAEAAYRGVFLDNPQNKALDDAEYDDADGSIRRFQRWYDKLFDDSQNKLLDNIHLKN